jgi:hypothetical protein
MEKSERKSLSIERTRKWLLSTDFVPLQGGGTEIKYEAMGEKCSKSRTLCSRRTAQ